MQLHIAPNRLVGEIQKEFNSVFPFLKIEFLNSRSFSRPGFPGQQLFSPGRKIGDSQLVVTDGDLEISEEMKVKELEKIFKDQFNLVVQVFRKSGNLWLETTMTDSWTLQQQNNHGREISGSKTTTKSEDDYDLTRDADH